MERSLKRLDDLDDRGVMNSGHSAKRTRSVMWYVDWIITIGVAGVLGIIAYLMLA